ncbi:MAG: thioesterase [Roseburia sp.]|nr:thioesterase [Roseburia sp.]
MYEYEIRVGYSETDTDLKMTVPAILDCFQNAAIFEAENGKITMDYLQERSLAWLLGSWQIVLLRRPRLNEAVRVMTSPYAFKGFMGYRNFTLTTPEGEMLVKAASIWTLIDTQRLCPAKPNEELLNGYELREKLDMEYAPRRIAVSGEGRMQEPFRVRRYQIDSNRHVNNVEYVRMAMELLPEAEAFNAQIKELRVEYKKAAHFGDSIVPTVYENGEKLQVQLGDAEGGIYAIVEFTL